MFLAQSEQCVMVRLDMEKMENFQRNRKMDIRKGILFITMIV